MAGRRADSDEAKALRGTARPDRSSSDAPPPSAERPTAPAYLTEAEAAVFEAFVARLAELGRASATHTAAIALAAQRQVQINELGEAIAEIGAVYKTVSVTGADVIKANPAVAMRSTAMRHLHSLLAELGLTPTSSSKAGGGAKKDGANPFENY